MGGRVAAQLALVDGLGDRLAVAHERRRRSGRRSCSGARRGGREREPHEVVVAHQSLVAAITIDAIRQTIRITIATVHERGIGQA